MKKNEKMLTKAHYVNIKVLNKLEMSLLLGKYIMPLIFVELGERVNWFCILSI